MEPTGDVALGLNVVRNKALYRLRTLLGLSSTGMAELLQTSPVTYKGWESNPETELWPTTASRIGRFYRAAAIQLQLLQNEGIDIATLQSMPRVANKLGLAHEVMLAWYREGAFMAVDLGILGMWVNADDIEAIKARSRRLVA